MTFQDVLIRRGIRYRISGEKLHINCPFCILRGKPQDTKQRLCIHIKKQWSRCMHCDWKHKYAVSAILKQLGIVADNIEISVEAKQEEKAEVVTLPEDFQHLVKTTDDFDKQARRYLLGRGITKEQIRENNIGVSYVGRYAYRVVFPIYMDGVLSGINSRDFTGRLKPKYMTSRGIKCLYNFDPNAETTIFSEGVFKALRIAQVTKHGSAALLGHDLTDVQLGQIQQSHCKHVILYPDIDRVGKLGALKIADKLCENWQGRVSFIWPVLIPADEQPLEDLRNDLQHNRIPYSGLTRPKLLL